MKDMTQTLADDHFLLSRDSVEIHAEQTLLKTYTVLIYCTHMYVPCNGFLFSWFVAGVVGDYM